MSQQNPSRNSASPVLSRRTVFAGAGAAGAAVAAAALLPGVTPQTPVVAAAPSTTQTGGYQLTEHVQRYYQTAKI